MRENYLTEAFKDMDALNEDVFSLDDKGAEALKDFLDGDKNVDFIGVIDVEAETEDDLKDSYLGKVILDCCTCHSKCYKDKEDVVLDENEEYANVGEECAYCHSTDGFKVVGEVTEFDAEETEDEDEDEKEVEIKKDSEEKFYDDASSFDFEEEEEEKVEESLNEKVSKTDDIDAEADDKKEIAKKRFMRAKDDADSDRDYRLKKGITRRNESKIYKKIKEAKKCEGFECKDEECEDKKIDEAPFYELHPKYDSRQSFYGKAHIDTGDKGDKNKLYSYDTLVAEMIDGKPVVYGTYSATTLRHIKDWLKQNGFKAENKAQIEADYGKKDEAKKCEGAEKCNEAYYDTTKVLEIVSPKTRARLKRIIDTQKQKYGNDMEVSVMIDSPYKAHLNYGEGGADYTKGEDGKWSHDFGYIKIDSALANAIISDVCKAVGMCEKMNESVEEVKVTTETDEVNVKTEDGKVTVETQKREDEEKKDEEVIEPVSDEVKSEIEAGSEEEVDGEFGDEVEVDMDEFDEESFDELGESYFKNAYSNIDSYKTSCVKAEGKRMVIEGVIKFKSGKEKATSFVLESKEITKNGKSRFIGENMQICKGKKAFALNGTINGGKFISESFNYDYRTKDIKTGKSKRISGTVSKK